MSQNTKNNNSLSCGFTLIELLIAVVIFGIISIISVQGLYDIVSIRAKQQTIEDGSDTIRVIARQISKSVIEADEISINPSGDILTTENDIECHTFAYKSGLILHERLLSTVDPDTGTITQCIPITNPDELSTDDAITPEDLSIDSFLLEPLDDDMKAIELEIAGSYRNSLGDHPVKYSTTITRRN